MGLVGPRGGRSGSPPGRGVGQIGGAEPSADGLRAGPGDLGSLVGEHHADQFRSPGGMLAAHGQGGLADRVGMGMGRGRGRFIAGNQARGSPIAATFQQMANRADWQGEGVGQGNGGLALSGTLPDYLPHRDGDGFGHRSGLPGEAK
jgi:hypothetical protein